MYRRGAPLEGRLVTGYQPDNLVEEDIRCDDCGKRSRAGFAPPVEPCWAGEASNSDHNWVLDSGDN